MSQTHYTIPRLTSGNSKVTNWLKNGIGLERIGGYFEPKLFSDQFAAAVFDLRMAGKAQVPRSGTPDVVSPL
jgi:hypothetical protein